MTAEKKRRNSPKEFHQGPQCGSNDPDYGAQQSPSTPRVRHAREAQ